MISVNNRVSALGQLANYLLSDEITLTEAINEAEMANGWFTTNFTRKALRSIAKNYLAEDKLNAWLANYPAVRVRGKTVGIIMAGNIPLAGFHDLLCVLLAGHNALIKPSSKDSLLLKHIIEKLGEYDRHITADIRFWEAPTTQFDAVIATGSTNTGRYFDYYFGKYPHIIRKNRNTLAVLTGNESDKTLEKLGNDIFDFYGLGCRSVSKLFLPQKYAVEDVARILNVFETVMQNHKYKNNYDYSLTLLLMNKIYHIKNNCCLFVEDESLTSRIATLHYQFYHDVAEVEQWIDEHRTAIQCVIGDGYIPFGQAQQPQLTDYADGVDTMAFLTAL